MASIYDLRPGEELQIGNCVVKMVKKSGQLARLVVTAPDEVPVKRVKPLDDSKTAADPLSMS